MILRVMADTLNKVINKMETITTGRKFTLGVCAAATAGVITGILIGHKSRMKRREDTNRTFSNTAVTIEVHDFKRLLIESLE